MDTDTTNLVDGGDTSEADTAGNDTGVELEAEQPELDENGDPIAIDEDEEIDLDDLKLKVPKDQAQKVREALLRQADYTRKTQEVAELRKAVETERSNLHRSSQAELDTYAAAKSMEGQLAQYERIDWDAWHDQDPFAASAATSKYQVLQRQYNQAMGHLSNLRGQRQSAAQQETAKRIEDGRASLAREVPGWNDDLKAKLITFANGFGFSRDELDDLEADPRVAKVLHAAFSGSQTTQAAKKVQNHIAAQAVQPAAKVGTSKAPTAGLDDRTSIDTWMERRNAQTRRKR